jgi:integrase
MERLRKRKERKQARPHDLVFGNTKRRPDSEMDTVVKRGAERAGLNCGQCVTEHKNKCAEGPYCMNFFLHKFRHTFATSHLRDGVDIRTVQSWLGHRDIQSTVVYLKGVRPTAPMPVGREQSTLGFSDTDMSSFVAKKLDISARAAQS